MVDVGDKAVTERLAVASGSIRMQGSTLAMILEGGHKKGDVLGVARIAGIMVPNAPPSWCRLPPTAADQVGIEFALTPGWTGIHCTATAKTRGQTGVEMEALALCRSRC